MSEELQASFQQIAHIPLPFTLRFTSKTMRLEELLSEQEAQYRNRSYLLQSLDKKSGELYLAKQKIASVVIEEKGKKILLKGGQGRELELLSDAALNGEIMLAASLGRAGIPGDKLAALGPGALIALDQPADFAVAILIPEIDYIFAFGEPVSISENYGDTFGIRVTSMENGFRLADITPGTVRGEVFIGDIVLSPSDLDSIGEGTTLKLGTPLTPNTLTLSDGTKIDGYLQHYDRKELLSEEACINKEFIIDHNSLLAFRVTASQLESSDVSAPRKENAVINTGAAPSETARIHTAKTEAVDIIAADIVFRELPRERSLSVLAHMSSDAAVWFLKMAEPSTVSRILLELVLSFGEEKGGAFLEAFTLCRPAVTSKEAACALLGFFNRYLDKMEIEELRQKSGECASIELPEGDPIERAAEYFSLMRNNEQRVLLQWLDIRNTPLYATLRNRLFLFEDIVALSDRNMQKLLREIDLSDFVEALSGDEDFVENVKAKVFQNMSERAVRIFNEELRYNNGVSEERREAARSKIIQILLSLINYGGIVL
jgi:flagellar motor switch/type III secretory pathway protein FliN